MALQLTLATTTLGQQANLIVVEFTYGGSMNVTFAEYDYSQYLVTISVGGGSTYDDIASALAATTDCPVYATYSTANGADASVTGVYLGISGATDGQGTGQFYSGVPGRPISFRPQYIKRKSGFLGH
jgi:hypothetical protein